MVKPNNKGFILNIVAIVVVLGIVFLSQQANYDYIGDWFKTNIYPRVSHEIESRGEEVQKEVLKQKDMVAQSLWDKIKIFFQEKFNTTFKTNVK